VDVRCARSSVATVEVTFSLSKLHSLNVRLDMAEVEEIYLPLSRLPSLYVAATQLLFRTQPGFLGTEDAEMPYIIGVAGSVAVGKSTTARVLQALLARWTNVPKVDLVTTDGFIYANTRRPDGEEGFPRGDLALPTA
jgi:type I pantothenate kinase